jgi:hypothetical protein
MAEYVRAGTGMRPARKKRGRTLGHRPGRAEYGIKTLAREWRQGAWPRSGTDPRRGEDVYPLGTGARAGTLLLRSPRGDADSASLQVEFPNGLPEFPAKKQTTQDQTHAQQPKKCHAELVAFSSSQ